MENDNVNAEKTSDDASTTKPYDLEERTALFGEAIIRFLRTLPRDEITVPLIGQAVRFGHKHWSELLRGGRCGLEERFSSPNQHLQEGIA